MKKKTTSKKVKIALICAIIFSSLALSVGITYASYAASARVNDSSGNAVTIGSNGRS